MSHCVKVFITYSVKKLNSWNTRLTKVRVFRLDTFCSVHSCHYRTVKVSVKQPACEWDSEIFLILLLIKPTWKGPQKQLFSLLFLESSMIIVNIFNSMNNTHYFSVFFLFFLFFIFFGKVNWVQCCLLEFCLPRDSQSRFLYWNEVQLRYENYK